MADSGLDVCRRRSFRKASQSSYIVSRNAKKELREKMKKVSEVLKKPEQERTLQDKVLVKKNPELVQASQKNARRLQATKERILEVEDESQLLVQKYKKLADLIKSSKNVVVYTGAGISTAASIPDYRGPNGVWTLLKKGQELSPQELSDAEPTFTHMSLTKLFKVGKVKHIVSQNCDGLHIRSGFPRHAISEVHGNMYIECCYSCTPYKEFVRLFDVTERTGVHRHATLRCCRTCGGSLQDTIVHFGEKGKLKSPYRWKEAVRAAKRADLILCLGSSLKVLRKYSCLWCMDKKPQQRPKLVVVNLQWTPKDDIATLKINGRCDTVMMNVMSLLNYQVPGYKREKDPIFQMCTPLRASERKTTTKKILIPPTHQAIKRDNRSQKKVASTSAKPKRSTRLTKSAKGDSDCNDHLFSKSSPLNPELYINRSDEQLMEEHNINFYSDMPSEDFTESSTVYYPLIVNLLQLQSSPTASNNSLICNSYHESSEDISHLKYHDIVEPFELFTGAMAQSFKCHIPPQEQDTHISATENNSLSEQKNNSGYQNQNAPELVVVNLGKDYSICEWEKEKLGEVYTFSNENIPECEAVVCVHSWAMDEKVSDIFVTDPEHTSSKQTRNVFQKSSPSRTRHNLSYMLDNTLSDSLSGDIIYSHKESAFQVNVISGHLLDTGGETNHISDHLLGTGGETNHISDHLLETRGETNHISDHLLGTGGETNHISDHLLGTGGETNCHISDNMLSSAESLLKQFPCSFSCTKDLQNGDNKLTLKQNGTHFVTNNIKQRNEEVALPTFHQVLNQIKGVCLDHCYTLPQTSTHIQKIAEPIQVNDINAKVDKQTKCSFSFADQILHSFSKYSICQEAHSESYLHLSKPLILEMENSSSCNTGSLQFSSSKKSIHSGIDSLDNSVVEFSTCGQLVSKEKTHIPAHISSDHRQNSHIFAFSDVPSCILNMDDMEIVYPQGIQPGQLLDCCDHLVTGYTNVVEIPTAIFPWSSKVLVLPTNGAQFQSSELQTFEADLLIDSCPLELQLAQPANGTIYENNSICCSKSCVNCFLSNAVEINDQFAESKVPEILFEPNVHSLFYSKEQNSDMFKDNDNESFVDNGKQSIPTLGRIYRKPIDKVCKCNFRNTFIALQKSLELEDAEKAGIEACHTISKGPVNLKKGNNNCDNKKKGRENVCRKVYKRKEGLAAVPGWFGKGLIVRKKRK